MSSDAIKRLETLDALLTARAAVSIPANSFVFRPGGVAQANVYMDWPSLMTAIGRVAGPKWIQIDSSIAPTHVTPGIWNVDGCTFVQTNGTLTPPQTVLTFDQGAHFTFTTLTVLAGVLFSNNSTVVVATLTTPFQLNLDGGGGGVQNSGNPGIAPWLRASADGDISLRNGAVLGDGLTASITVDVGHSVQIDVDNNAALSAQAVTGAGSMVVNLTDSGGIDVQTVAGQSVTHISIANQVDYTPATLAHWSGVAPTSVADALDRIATKITPIP